MWGGRSRRTNQPPCSLWVLILYRLSLYIIIVCAQDQSSSSTASAEHPMHMGTA